MNIEFEILREHSKRQAEKISRWVGNDDTRFAELMVLFLNGGRRIAQRASWIVSLCGERHPNLVGPWLARIVRKAAEKDIHDGVKRNIVRVLQFVDIPKRLQGSVANLCFEFLQSVEAPIALKAFSMTVLANIADQQPDLKRELAMVIDEMLPYGGPGIRARGKKILRKISPPPSSKKYTSL